MRTLLTITLLLVSLTASADKLICNNGVCITVLDPPVEQILIPVTEDK